MAATETAEKDAIWFVLDELGIHPDLLSRKQSGAIFYAGFSRKVEFTPAFFHCMHPSTSWQKNVTDGDFIFDHGLGRDSVELEGALKGHIDGSQKAEWHWKAVVARATYVITVCGDGKWGYVRKIHIWPDCKASELRKILQDLMSEGIKFRDNQR